jgi:hypothetical protein
MAKQLQLRRGTPAQNAAFTGAVGELVAVTGTNTTVVIHDGITLGGHYIASKQYVDENLSNVTSFVATATTATLGLVKIGNGLTITNDGLLSGDITYEFSQILTITNDWQDVGINASQLLTGTYIVQIKANDYAVGGGHHSEYYSATMSWYGEDTNSILFDEVPMHRAGNGPGSGALFLRVQRTLSADANDMKLQIGGITNNSSPSLYVFKFRKIL